jgi:transmembrane sensor
MNNPRRIGRLLYKGSRSELNESEEKELTVWRKESPENEQLFWDRMDPEKVRSSMIRYYEKRDLIFEKIKKRVPELADAKLSNQDFSDFKEEGKYVRMYPFHLSRRAFFGALFVLGVLIYLLLRITGVINKTAITHKDAVGASPEGIEIYIDDASTGYGAGLADIDLKENKLGENDYYANSKNRDRKIRYSLPSGDQRHFRLILPDSTWIWVHPNTRIKYPVNFSQDSIHVTVLGKAYFEVNRDSLHPYIIIQPSIVNHLPSATLSIEAVSAHFDIEAYPDSSAMRITAITGNLFIRVDSVAGKKQSEFQLFAGQQLEAKDGKINVIQNVDVNKVLTRAKWYGGK